MEKVSFQPNDDLMQVSYYPPMPNVTRIHKDKLSKRIHFIPEWIEHRGLSQADVVRELDINKGTVSKWCSGDLPSEVNLYNIAALLEVEPNALFRHPKDDWLANFFSGRSEEEKQRIVNTLNAAFPKRDGTRG